MMSICVLLVDDEPALLELGSTYLSCADRDLRIKTAASARDALEKIRVGHFDVIVSDYEMPGMNGIGLLKELKSEGCTIPFILFTGRGREEVVIEALNNGAAFYLQKGGEPKAQFTELIHKIREAVGYDRTKRAAEETRQRMADILDFLPDPTIAIDAGGTLIVWNRAAEELTGVPADALLKKGNYEYAIPLYGERRPILPDLILHPDAVVLNNEYHVKTNEPDLLIAESQATLPSGKTVILWIKATPFRDRTGTITGVIATLRDITKRKEIIAEQRRFREMLEQKNRKISENNERLEAIQQDLLKKNEELGAACGQVAAMEEEVRHTLHELEQSQCTLQENEQAYRQVIESLPYAVVIHDRGSVLYANRIAGQLWCADESVPPSEKDFYSWFVPGSGDEVARMSRQVQDEGRVIPHTRQVVAVPGGREIPVGLTLCPIRYHGSNAVFGILHDFLESEDPFSPRARHPVQDAGSPVPTVKRSA